MSHNLSRSIGKLGLVLRKNMPTITTVASAAGVIGTSILTARAAYKSCPAIEEHKDIIEQLRANKDAFDSEKEYNKEVVAVYKKTGIELVKCYWPAAAATGLTIAGIFATNSMHRKRYFAMAGMYAAVSTAYNDYRKRVKDKYGAEAERDLYLNLQREEVLTVETDKKGKEKTKVDVVVKPGSVEDSNYSICLIDENCRGVWYKNHPENTYLRLMGIQKELTQMLITRGYLWLNEVYHALGIPEVAAGQYIGWIYDPNDPTCDNAVDFGLDENSKYFDTQNFERFISGKYEFVYITFNHNGTILDRFEMFDKIFARKGRS